MAKRRTTAIPARKQAIPREDDSLLIESAESLGRVLGSLREQVFGAQKPAEAVKPSPTRKRAPARKTGKKR